MKKKTKKHSFHKHIYGICTTCVKGSCCKDGVEVDLKQAQRIARLHLGIPKPWFVDLIVDRDFPSGWAVSTVVRNGRCVFQAQNHRCRIYPYRPYYCREFPIEDGTLHSHYHYLCEKPHHVKRKVRKYFKSSLRKERK